MVDDENVILLLEVALSLLDDVDLVEAIEDLLFLLVPGREVVSLTIVELELLEVLFLCMAIINSAASLSSSRSADISSVTPVKLQLKPQGGGIFLELLELPLL